MSMVVLGAAWAVAFAVVPPPERPSRARWFDADAWRPLLTAYKELATPGGVAAFGRGPLAAVPINVLLVGAVSLAAGAQAYSSLGSTDRDQMFRLVFVLLAIATLVRYLVRARR
ncbi:MAG: hypothetical protein ACR2GT_13445 [Gaiellaceae bacterium]